MASLLHATGPFANHNVRWYSWFTIAFNARFYYPILAILFLDLGLSLAQFVTLNAIWAATIFLTEVPSGALADIIGRRKLLIAAAALMILEMIVLLAAPRDAGLWLFAFCAVNRILSGLAEAAASGADEALAYDSLDDPSDWDDVLDVTMRWKSVAMVIAMITGALAYDAAQIGLNRDLAHRLPVAFCLLQAIAAFVISLKFREIPTEDRKAGFKEVFQQTWVAARWVVTTKAAILIVIGGLLIDGVMRNFATINSEYYRLIELPTYTFGFIAAGTSVTGIFIPRLSKHLVKTFSPLTNLSLTAAWSLLCLTGLAQTWNYWGVIPAIGTMAGLYHLAFIISRYLNDLASSRQRATVLSVKGLLFNIGYGSASLIFAGTVAHQKDLLGSDNAALTATLGLQPLAFAGVFLVFVITAKVLGMPKSTR